MANAYYVKALWDAEAEVWVSETDIPGLVIEADTLAEFENLFQDLAPEMLALNAGVHDRKIIYTFSAEGRRELMVA